MKKILLIGSVLALTSTSVFASQARLLALGMRETDNDGMYHISDARNIFLNPAYINLFSDYATVEFGNTGFNAAAGAPTGTIAATVDQYFQPKAQGGAFRKFGDLVYGVYLGNESNTSSLLRIVGTSSASVFDQTTTLTGAVGTQSKMLQTADNQVDLFIGGDNGIKWAANALYSHGNDESRSAKDTAIATRFGVIGSNWDAHLNLSLASKAEATDTITATGLGIVTPTAVRQEFEGKLGVQVGGSVVVSGNNRIFGYAKHYGWEQTDSFNYSALSAPVRAAIGGQTGTVKGDFTSYYLGWGSHSDVNTTDKLFYSLAAKKTDINAKFATKGEIRHLVVPLTIAYEATATEWLVLRGSIIHNLYGQRDNKGLGSLNPVARSLITGIYGTDGKSTVANSTEVNAGATLKFGNLSVDGLIGTTGTAGAPASKTGVLSFENLLAKTALTYNF